MRVAIGLFFVVNMVAAIVTVADKRRARRGMRRVPERTLWALALCGGAVGVYTAMRAVRHKTKHPSFMWGLPLVIVAQAAVVWLLHNGVFVTETVKNFLH